MRKVIEQERLRAVVFAELPAPQPVPRGDRQRGLGGRNRGQRDADPPADQRSQHGEETAVRAGDRARIGAVFVQAGETVQQVFARHANGLEREPAVVHPVEPDLGAAVLDAHPRQGLATRIADRHHESVNAAGLPAQQELREDHGDLPMQRGIADVVLARRAMGRLEHEVAGGRIVGGGGFERLHVRAVPRFGHRETSRQLEPAGGAQVAAVMVLRAQLLNGAGEEPELHAELDQQRQIVVRQGLEDGDERAGVVAPAVRRRHRQAPHPSPARRRHQA